MHAAMEEHVTRPWEIVIAPMTQPLLDQHARLHMTVPLWAALMEAPVYRMAPAAVPNLTMGCFVIWSIYLSLNITSAVRTVIATTEPAMWKLGYAPVQIQPATGRFARKGTIVPRCLFMIIAMVLPVSMEGLVMLRPAIVIVWNLSLVLTAQRPHPAWWTKTATACLACFPTV